MVGEPLIDEIVNNPKVLPYIDMPLQHGDDRMLAAMKRGGSSSGYCRLFDRMRERIPNLTLRTTFIVGFPGETELQFDNLMRFVDEVRFDRVGVFTYSKEENTPAASLPDEVPHRTAIKRRDVLMTAQRAISLEANKAWLGREIDVLIEFRRGEDAVGRSVRDAPEIDGSVIVQGCRCEPGSIVCARVVSAGHYDLKAEFVAPDRRPATHNRFVEDSFGN
jgi:ribosomal protein S12 methylthiotransferase